METDAHPIAWICLTFSSAIRLAAGAFIVGFRMVGLWLRTSLSAAVPRR
jgi:hypothetical protein